MPADFLSISPARASALARRGAALQVQRITLRTAAIASATAPGSMKQSIRPILKGTKSSPLGIIMVDHPAASYVLNGTRPHPIRPKRLGGVLRFTVGNHVVFARAVSHPGTKPNNFLWRALLAAKFNAR